MKSCLNITLEVEQEIYVSLTLTNHRKTGEDKDNCNHFVTTIKDRYDKKNRLQLWSMESQHIYLIKF